MKRNLSILVLVIITTFMPALSAVLPNQPELYMRWSGLSSDQLLHMGNVFIEHRNQPDSALLCYSIIVNRNSNSSKTNEKEITKQALMGKWRIYFYNFFDLRMAFESLTQAEDVSKDLKSSMSDIYQLWHYVSNDC